MAQLSHRRSVTFARKEDTLPAVLSQDEVLRLLKAETNLKMRTAYTAIYAAGLRVSEVVALTITDIDSTRKVIDVRQAKRPQGSLRHAVRAIADYPSELLAPGSPAASAVSRPQSIEAGDDAVGAARLSQCRRCSGSRRQCHRAHLRHSFATHLLEQGVDIRVIQDLLGHRNINTTTRYARVAVNMIRQVESPLEALRMELVCLDVGR